MDPIDLCFGTPTNAFAAHAAVEPGTAPDEETGVLLSVVSDACRHNARWAVPLLIDTARNGGISHLRRIAYVLATAQHAAGFGAQLEARRADGERFRGRGFIFITGRAAYAAWSKRLELPDAVVDGVAVPYFVAHPAALAHPRIAAQTLVRGMRDGLFTGFALGSYVNDKKTDYHGAARAIAAREHARDIAETAARFAHALEDVHADRHRRSLRRIAPRRSLDAAAARDPVGDVRAAVARLAARGDVMPDPEQVVEWNGEARQGRFVHLDADTCALHVGRGTYVRLDVQRDLNGLVPPEARNVALKRSGDVRPAASSGEANFWR